jgi:threonine dehydrogenase-like Zn-dependent dehydrogenase
VQTDLPDEQLALIGCGVTTGIGAVLNTAAVCPGSSVAVLGCGGVGQSVIQGARIAGASRIIAVDGQPLKREQALTSGATDAVDPAQGDAAAQVKELTGGRGVDYAFEVIGLPEMVVTRVPTTLGEPEQQWRWRRRLLDARPNNGFCRLQCGGYCRHPPIYKSCQHHQPCHQNDQASPK